MANKLVLASISLIILVLSVSPLTTSNTPILDTDGNPVQPGARYYIRATPSGFGRGGLIAASKGPTFCPLFVGQHNSWTHVGSPVIIVPSKAPEKVISTGMDVNIAFSGPNIICSNSNVWLIYNSDGVLFISTFGGPGPFEESTFEIRESGFNGSYKIVFCNIPGEDCRELKATVPASNERWSWLTLVPIQEDPPFSGFVFQRVQGVVALTDV